MCQTLHAYNGLARLGGGDPDITSCPILQSAINEQSEKRVGVEELFPERMCGLLVVVFNFLACVAKDWLETFVLNIHITVCVKTYNIKHKLL